MKCLLPTFLFVLQFDAKRAPLFEINNTRLLKKSLRGATKQSFRNKRKQRLLRQKTSRNDLVLSFFRSLNTLFPRCSIHSFLNRQINPFGYNPLRLSSFDVEAMNFSTITVAFFDTERTHTRHKNERFSPEFQILCIIIHHFDVCTNSTKTLTILFRH
jgi:hypothetical protein